MNAYLQRADDFIQQQIYKFEQKKQGREYSEMQQMPQSQYPHPARAQTFHSRPPPQGPPAPNGWTQEFDTASQRWYYLDRATGRSQWHPPSYDQSASGHGQPLSHSRHHSNTFHDEQFARRLQEEEERGRVRTNSQPPRPQSGLLGVPQQQQRPVSTSPHPSPLGRLPPGAHLNMKTGEIVYNMYPKDHPINAQ